jgi:hypothetical protein
MVATNFFVLPGFYQVAFFQEKHHVPCIEKFKTSEEDF